MSANVELRVKVSRVVSSNPKGFGGCIFNGSIIDAEGLLVSGSTYAHVEAKSSVLPSEDSVWAGDVWLVKGQATYSEHIVNNSYKTTEVKVAAESMTRLRLTFESLIESVAASKRYAGIGRVQMTRLCDAYGEQVMELLDNGDKKAVAAIIGETRADTLLAGWKEDVSSATRAFLREYRIPPAISRRVIEYYGEEAEVLLKEDPYRFLSFAVDWHQIDSIARRRFSVADNDPRRLAGAVESAIYYLVDKKNHTVVDTKTLSKQLVLRLGSKELAELALASEIGNGSYVQGPDGIYWSIGTFTMENTIAARVVEMVTTPEPAVGIFHDLTAKELVEAQIFRFEAAESTRQETAFALTEGQREAVLLSATSRFSVITGGAGTGKTTVLKCLYSVLSSSGYSITQMALSGRATKRMRDATGYPASTIASFIWRAKKNTELDEETGETAGGAGDYYIIDEASMLDVMTMYSLLRLIPPGARLVLVGDPYQLPPIRAGLVFHILAELNTVPITRLSEVKRQDSSTGIPSVAEAVRFGSLPSLPQSGAGVVFIPSGRKEVIGKVVELYKTDPANSQVISALNNCPDTGVRAINHTCHDEFGISEEHLLIVEPESGTLVQSGFCLGEKVMFTRNDWARNINNGSIGTITELLEVQPEAYCTTDEDTEEYREPVIAIASVDGENISIFRSDIIGEFRCLEYGYCTSVHKAQGSQWNRVIVPIRGSRILDRTLVYTAITRAVEQVILVGDLEALRTAVTDLPSSSRRMVGLKQLLLDRFQ